MSCEDRILYVRCGTTLSFSFLNRDKETKLPITIDDFQARGSILDCNDHEVKALDTSYFDIPAGEGRANLTVGSDETPDLSPQNERVELKLYIELFDTSSPPVVKPMFEGPLVVLPDLTP